MFDLALLTAFVVICHSNDGSPNRRLSRLSTSFIFAAGRISFRPVGKLCPKIFVEDYKIMIRFVCKSTRFLPLAAAVVACAMLPLAADALTPPALSISDGTNSAG